MTDIDVNQLLTQMRSMAAAAKAKSFVSCAIGRIDNATAAKE